MNNRSVKFLAFLGVIFNKKDRILCHYEKSPYLCIAFENKGRLFEIAEIIIGIWCNGNTTDSGPVFPGSSPGIPTKERLPMEASLLSYIPLNDYNRTALYLHDNDIY